MNKGHSSCGTIIAITHNLVSATRDMPGHFNVIADCAA